MISRSCTFSVHDLLRSTQSIPFNFGHTVYNNSSTEQLVPIYKILITWGYNVGWNNSRSICAKTGRMDDKVKNNLNSTLPRFTQFFILDILIISLGWVVLLSTKYLAFSKMRFIPSLPTIDAFYQK